MSGTIAAAEVAGATNALGTAWALSAGSEGRGKGQARP
jgi:hypothetical protein